MTGNNLVYKIKVATKMHILTDKQGMPLSAIISATSSDGMKAVTNVTDNSFSHIPSESAFTKKKRRWYYHLCLHKAHHSNQ